MHPVMGAEHSVPMADMVARRAQGASGATGIVSASTVRLCRAGQGSRRRRRALMRRGTQLSRQFSALLLSVCREQASGRGTR